jgi:hypothetical protein
MSLLDASWSTGSKGSFGASVSDDTHRHASWVYVDLSSHPCGELRALATMEVWGMDAELGRLNGIVVDPALPRVEYLIVETEDALRALPAESACFRQGGMILADVRSPLFRLFPTLNDLVGEKRPPAMASTRN